MNARKASATIGVRMQIGAMHQTPDSMLRTVVPVSCDRIRLWTWDELAPDDPGRDWAYEMASLDPPVDCAFDDPELL